MIVNRSRPPGVISTFYYDDVRTAIDWLCGALGFTVRFRYGPEEHPAGAQLSAGDGTIMLSAARVGQRADWGDNAVLSSPRSGSVDVILSVHVEDVDQVFERAKQFGAHILHEPETYPFGERQFTAEDPSGYRWSFSQSVADVAPSDWGAHVSDAR